MNIFKHLLFLMSIFLCLENTALLGMEEGSLDKPPLKTTGNQTPKKKHRKRKNKNSKLAQAISQPSQEVSTRSLPRYCNAQELAELHAGLKDIPASLGINSLKTKKEIETYLQKLHILTNILVVLERFSNQLQNIAAIDTKALTTVHRMHPIKWLFFQDDAVLFDDTEEGCVTLDAEKNKKVFPNAYFLQSPAAKAATMQGQRIYSTYQNKVHSVVYDHTKTSLVREKQIDKLFAKEFEAITQFLTFLDCTQNEELRILSNWFKNTIAQQKRSLAIKDLVYLMDIIALMDSNDSFEKPFLKTNPALAYNLLKIIKNKQSTMVFEQWLRDVCPFVKTYIPHIFNLLEVIELITNASHTIDQEDEYLDFKQNSAFNLIINHALLSLKENEQNYKKLYSFLREEQKKFFLNRNYESHLKWLKKYTTTLLITREDGKLLPNEIFAQEKDCGKEYDWLDAAKDFHAQQKKIDQQRQTKNQQRKAAKRKNQHAQESNEKEKEKGVEEITVLLEDTFPSFEQPITAPDLHMYDYRCLRWFFDKDFLARNNFDRKKLLKHTFDFACDYYIFNYGIQKPRQNATHPGQIDTAYYLGGEICYPDGKRETVIFVCTKDPNGICYHKGIEPKDESLFSEFANNKFEYDFPKYYLALESQEKLVEFAVNDEFYSKTCVENQFYITIKDTRNGVTLILFKPDFQASTIH